MIDNTRTPYEQIGGEEGVRRLVDRFYDLMDNLPEAQPIRGMHAKSLRSSREKLFLFLSGWLGGPGLYQEKYGHPMLRRRHLPFPIGRAERDQWMTCMTRALHDTVEDEGLRGHLRQAFFQVADHMRNRPEAGGEAGLRIIGQPSSQQVKAPEKADAMERKTTNDSN
jgi:hemoglobin